MDKKSRDFTNNLGVSKSKHLALRKDRIFNKNKKLVQLWRKESKERLFLT